MCGRARCTLRPDDIPRACYRDRVPARFLHTDRFRPSYNVAPGSNVPVVRRDSEGEGEGEGVVIHSMKWGLVPSFTKKTDKPDFFRMFNARCESISEKASFRRLLPKNRCLVAAEGFYEWKKELSKKQPYYIHFKDGRPLVFAAFYDSWQNSEGEILYTFTILTTSSSSALQWLHDRMPVIFGDKESADAWLDDQSTAKFKTVLKPYENLDLVWYPVTPAMGKTSFDGPECIQEIPLKSPEKNLISKFFSAKQPSKEETKRETEPVVGNIPDHLKQKVIAEDHKGAVMSDNMEKSKELSDKKTIPGETTNADLKRIIKEEPVVEGSTASLKSLKDEHGEEHINVQDKSSKRDLPKVVKEEELQTQGNEGVASSVESLKEEVGKGETSVIANSVKTDDPCGISKEDLETQHQPVTANESLNQSPCTADVAKEEPKNEDQMKVVSASGRDGGGLNSSEWSSAMGRKRDYEAFSAVEKQSKHSGEGGTNAREKFHELGRMKGQKKSDLKKQNDKQSTLHSYFGKK